MIFVTLFSTGNLLHVAEKEIDPEVVLEAVNDVDIANGIVLGTVQEIAVKIVMIINVIVNVIENVIMIVHSILSK